VETLPCHLALVPQSSIHHLLSGCVTSVSMETLVLTAHGLMIPILGTPVKESDGPVKFSNQ
jgi:hypothetical protein